LELGGQGLGQDVIEPPQELVADDGGKRHRNLPRVPKKKRAGVGTPNIFNTWNLKLAGAHLQ